MTAIIDNEAVNAVFERPAPDGRFGTVVAHYLRGVGARRPLLLLAFAPKAAGTYFRQAALEVLGGQLVRGSHAQGGRDGTPYLPNFLSCFLNPDAPPTVVHLHMQALAANRHFVQAFDLRPVIMLRNLPDMLASFWDMLENDPVARTEGLNCTVPPDFPALSRAQKADFLIDMIAPWYASYFATWKSYCDEAPDEVAVLHYTEFCTAPAAVLRRALSHAGFPVTEAVCGAALETIWQERHDHRFNKGAAGRGHRYFPQAHLAKIGQLLGHYPVLADWLPVVNGAREESAAAKSIGVGLD